MNGVDYPTWTRFIGKNMSPLMLPESKRLVLKMVKKNKAIKNTDRSWQREGILWKYSRPIDACARAAFTCSATGLEKLQPILSLITRFPLQGTLRVYTLLRSHWFLVPFSLILICHRTNLDFSFTIKQFSFECWELRGIALCLLISLCDWSRKLAPLSQPIRCKT